MNIKHVFLFFAVGALVVACKTPPIGHDGVSHKPVKTYEIEFVVKGDQKLNIVTPDKGCNKNENGCMRVPSANSTTCGSTSLAAISNVSTPAFARIER